MRIALAAVSFYNGKITTNKNIIIKYMKKYSENSDMIVFGEAFLQGFYALTFDYEKDLKVAVSINDEIIKEISKKAKEYNIAVSFGFIEKDNLDMYSSQITIDKTGKIIDLFRRVSTGWKTEQANEFYKEKDDFHLFKFLNKSFAVGLCGDLWYPENIKKLKELKPDIVLWPVYTDYNYKEWNESAKYEYAKQVKEINANVLYLNSVCADKNSFEIARGGAALFKNGEIISEVESGKDNVLVVCVD